ncbi:enoyl-CoA hydratase domain-containing protein 2, mitochondrial-like isoform X2 [Petaurus breviceps papuanus]|uniref:enoyl-CoA hydratase domain-containing protein 2, mitochondrial-like isoform X2 n=1 Tax=Petaurus breviceps papuanus TaxID=3040969 RepID=UPI0036DD3069
MPAGGELTGRCSGLSRGPPHLDPKRAPGLFRLPGPAALRGSLFPSRDLGFLFGKTKGCVQRSPAAPLPPSLPRRPGLPAEEPSVGGVLGSLPQPARCPPPVHVAAAAMLRTLPRALRSLVPRGPGWSPARGWASRDAALGAEIQVGALRGDRDAGIVEILMNRPQARNALGKVFISELSDALDELRLDRSIRVVVFKSCVKGVFCAATFPAPTIAAIDGFALGGGLELALACDLRVAASSAIMGLIETSRGLLPGAGGTQRLPRCVGVSLAKELIFTGRRINGEEAKGIGLVNHAVPQNQEGTAAYHRALELAREIVPQAPFAVRMGKVAIDKGMEVDITSGMAIEGMCYAQNIPTRDRLEGMAAFREKRPPRFVGE